MVVAVATITTTIDSRTSHTRRRLPHQLREMARLFREARRSLIVVVFGFVTPGVDGRCNVRVTFCEVFAVRTALKSGINNHIQVEEPCLPR